MFLNEDIVCKIKPVLIILVFDILITFKVIPAILCQVKIFYLFYLKFVWIKNTPSHVISLSSI